MSNEVLFLYLFTRLDSLREAAIAATVFGGAGVLVIAFGVFVEGQKWWLKRSFAAWVVCILMTVAIPTQKDAMFIIAGTGVIEAAKTDTAQRLASKSVLVVEKALDYYLKQQTTKEKSK